MSKFSLRRLAELRPGLILAVDGAVAALSFWVAMLLRFEGSIPANYRSTLLALIPVLVGCRILSSILFRLHRWSFRFSGLADGARVVMAGLMGTGLLLLTTFLVRHDPLPRSVVVMELLMSVLVMGALRFSPRLAGIYATDWVRSRSEGAVRTLIVGAGAAGEMLLRDLQRTQAHSYQVVGFVDDDASKRNHVVGGRTVLGGVDDLPRLARQHRVTQILIAIPLLQGRRIREILSVCTDLKLSFKILPVSYVYLHHRASSAMMQDLSPEDLLPREQITFGEQDQSPVFDRRALVTGAGGSIGGEICEQLLRGGLRTLVMLDINENAMYLLKRRFDREFPDAQIEVEVADIRDRGRISDLFLRYRPQDVFHAAAHKHVPLMERAPCEAVKNNIVGTRIVAEAAEAAACERFLYISTDKAVRATSVMGASKRIAEEVVRDMARRSTTRFCAVRFGNVLGSAGSVVPLFRQQIEAGGPVSVTHPDVRRYFMTIAEAVSLVLQAAYGDYGELCVLDMGEQLKIVDLARHLITMSGLVPDVDIPIVFTGLRPGEKLFEELLTEEEEHTRRVQEKIFVAECPPPPAHLDAALQELERVAGQEDADRTVELLFRLLPSYSAIPQLGPKPADAARGIETGLA